MSVSVINPAAMLGAAALAVARMADGLDGGAELTMPREVLDFLARLRLLSGVPFSHLVPDADLLPMESIRFFHVDRQWTDAMVEGALSVGTMTSADRELLQAVYPLVRDAVDRAERGARPIDVGPPGPASQATITGFLLRSSAVSGWPGLHVRGWTMNVDDHVPADAPGACRLLRLERLAPAVLLALFEGTPQVVHVEEPRGGVQLGVDLQAGVFGLRTAVVPLRDATTGARLEVSPGVPQTVDVPFRAGTPGVVHLRELAARIAAEPATHVTTGATAEVDSAELALQLLQFPYRQAFGPGTGPVPLPEIFTPTIDIQALLSAYGGGT